MISSFNVVNLDSIDVLLSLHYYRILRYNIFTFKECPDEQNKSDIANYSDLVALSG